MLGLLASAPSSAATAPPVLEEGRNSDGPGVPAAVAIAIVIEGALLLIPALA
jgi:hypothetical protein